ncbi:flavodoxin family protein [Pseudolysinimonas sp.]|jgi:hypothetical protein|uniref:flavodoxin family protein n=1 Tax=Pseudolysinimonas sp. TaxID=2680009 RepID=UPI0037848A71
MTEESFRALVAYESLFGASRRIAEAISAGLAQSGARVECRSIRDVDVGDLDIARLVVLGAPTHARSLPTPATRREGERWLDYRLQGRALEPRALEPGLREWIAEAPLAGRPVAAFTTRAELPRILSGSAGRTIARLVRLRGAVPVATVFEALVTERGRLLPEETDRARQWGEHLIADTREVADVHA